MSKATNIHVHSHTLTREERQSLKGHKPFVVWLTGLSGSGKSTIANALEVELHKSGIHTYLLDGDNVRSGLNSNLGFTDDDRKENIRRISEVAKLFADSGTVVITAFISPFIEDRDQARSIISTDFDFVEVHVDADLATCESRDPKGLYKKARAGQIPNFTGIDSPYEAPVNPEIKIDSSKYNINICVYAIIHRLYEMGLLKSNVRTYMENFNIPLNNK
jgi:adenylyl-sulfate kinase